MRTSPERDAWLRQRLKEAVASPLAGGSADKLGRALGYANGGFIREILDGKKPVRAAIIERANRVEGLRGWFDPPRSFADLAGPEAQLVMHLRWLQQRSLEAGANWANGVLQLVADLVEIPDASRDLAIGAAARAIEDARQEHHPASASEAPSTHPKENLP